MTINEQAEREAALLRRVAALERAVGRLHAHFSVSSPGDASITIEADTDNVDETHNPSLLFSQDAGGITAQTGIDENNHFYMNPVGATENHLFKPWTDYTPVSSGGMPNGDVTSASGRWCVMFGMVFVVGAVVYDDDTNSPTSATILISFPTTGVGEPDDGNAMMQGTATVLTSDSRRIPAGIIKGAGNTIQFVIEGDNYISGLELTNGGSAATQIRFSFWWPVGDLQAAS